MSVNEWIENKYAEFGRQWVESHYHDCINEIGKFVSTETYSRTLRRVVQNSKKIEESESQKVDHEPKPDTIKSSDVSTIEDLEDYSRFDAARFEITGGVVNTWGAPNNENKQVKFTFKPRKIPKTELIIDEFKKLVSEYSPNYEYKNRANIDSGNVVEIAVHDLHFGQLTWGHETRSGDYDVKIAEKTYLSAISHLIESTKSFNPSRYLFPIGSDFFNVNDKTNSTAHGTPQDEDSRWMKTFSLGCKMAIKAIDLASNIADVDVIVVRGNHDEERAYYLGEVLSAWYRNNKNVRIDNSPTLRKYYQYGKCLIGISHGYTEKADQLPLLMATEVPDMWASTEYREFHVGHFHHSSSKGFQQDTEKCGVRVCIIPSLAQPSAWSHNSGFKSLREAPAFVWNKEYGRIASSYYHPGMFVEGVE